MLDRPNTREGWIARAASLAIEGRAFIGGAYVGALDGGTFAKVSPIDGKVFAHVADCAGFWTPATTNSSARSASRRPKSAKARSRGEFGRPCERPALWGFDFHAGLWRWARSWREAAWTGCGEGPGSAQWGSRWRGEGYERPIDWLIGVIESRGIAAGVEPAQRNGKAAALAGGLAHDVSIRAWGRPPPRLAAAREDLDDDHAGAAARAWAARARGASGVTSGCGCGSAAGGSAPSSARAVAMFSARLALAKSP